MSWLDEYELADPAYPNADSPGNAWGAGSPVRGEHVIARVLNGTVTEGDMVAYSTREGSSQDMHVGVVREVLADGFLVRLRVGVQQSSSTFSRVPRNVTIGNVYRVVKISFSTEKIHA
jgi:hypothetical protein